MNFRIPKQPKAIKERIDVKLERTLLETLDQYCQYLESDRDYVLSEVLRVAFKKDKGFVAWRATPKPADETTRPQRA